MGPPVWQEIVDFFYIQRASASTRRFDQPAAAPSDLINRIGDAGL